MRVLAIDSSGLTATVAMVEDDQTIAEYTTNYKKTHSQTLLPMIDEMVKMVDADLSSIDAIAVSGGPGSFTGLRIGSATAKGLGLALGKPLIHVPTVEAMAYSMYGCEDIICPIMDARRKQVYTGLYSFVYEKNENGGFYDEPEFRILQPQTAVAVEELIRQLNIHRRRSYFSGTVCLFTGKCWRRSWKCHIISRRHLRTGRERPRSGRWVSVIMKREDMKAQLNSGRNTCANPRRSGNVPIGRKTQSRRCAG